MAFQIMFQPSNNRVSIRKDRVFRDRSHPLDIYDDAELIRRYRMPRHCILDLIDTLSTDLEPPTMRSHSIPASLQIFAALRYYATGSFQQVYIIIYMNNTYRNVSRYLHVLITFCQWTKNYPQACSRNFSKM